MPQQKSPTVQFTVRGVPSRVDKALRRRARAAGKSLNAVLVEALTSFVEDESSEKIYTDLDHLAGRWVEVSGFDEAIRDQRHVDLSKWRWELAWTYYRCVRTQSAARP